MTAHRFRRLRTALARFIIRWLWVIREQNSLVLGAKLPRVGHDSLTKPPSILIVGQLALELRSSDGYVGTLLSFAPETRYKVKSLVSCR